MAETHPSEEPQEHHEGVEEPKAQHTGGAEEQEDTQPEEEKPQQREEEQEQKDEDGTKDGDSKDEEPPAEAHEEQAAAAPAAAAAAPGPVDYMKRPARRQSTEVKEYTPVMSGDYNIWYHRYIGYEYHESRKDRGVLTRCCVKTDAGRTRASPTAPICIHFALGNCVRGHECHYRHCLPTDMDERRVGVTHDVFGRERFKTDRDDMGGVGSFSRENRTLYIGGLNADTSVPECEGIVRRHFGEWGDLEYVRAFPDRGFAFVRYRLRTAAEFAKVAMADQSLDGNETLNVRWAYDDPNPIAKAHEEQAATARFVAAVQQAADDRAAAAAKATGAATSAEPPAAKRPAPTVDVPRSAPKVQYKYVFVGQTTQEGGGGAAAAGGGGGEKQFSVNPYTRELHPYAQGVYHMRQVREAPRSSSSNTRAPASAPAPVVAPSQQKQPQVAPTTVFVPPPPAPPPASDEPGFYNDEPLV